MLNIYIKQYLKLAKSTGIMPIIILIPIIIVKAMLTVVMAVMLMPLFANYTNSESSGESNILGSLEHYLDIINDFSGINNYFIIIVLIISTVALFQIILGVLYHYIHKDYLRKTEILLRKMVFDSLLSVDWIYFIKLKGANIINLLIRETSKSTLFIGNTIDLFDNFATVIIYSISAAIVSVDSIYAGVIVFILLIFVFYPISRLLKKLGQESLAASQTFLHILGEYVYGLKVVRASSMENHARAKFGSNSYQYSTTMFKSNMTRIIPSLILQPTVVIVIVVIMYFHNKHSPAGVGEIAVLAFLFLRLFQQVAGVQSRLAALGEYVPSLKNISLFTREFSHNKEQTGDYKLKEFLNISFKNVSFGYKDNVKVLDGISFDIIAGETIGFVGASGAGKTTLVDLCLSLISPVGGQIKINNVSIDSIDRMHWRKKIGYVPQESLMFNESIMKNITLGKADIDPDYVKELAKSLDVFQFVYEKEHGFDTIIGDKGVQLSGGQKQRISLLRALASKPEVLILDEATSALDNLSERKIQKAIEKLHGKYTIIIIAHRTSTVINVDRLFVLDKGLLVKSGNPKELLSSTDWLT